MKILNREQVTPNKKKRIRRQLIVALSTCTETEFLQLMRDHHYLYSKHQKGSSASRLRLEYITKLFLRELGEYLFTGATPPTPGHPFRDEELVSMLSGADKKTSQYLFGKGIKKWITPRPFMIYHFENERTGGHRHIHTIHHFPPAIERYAPAYMKMFQDVWNAYSDNNIAQRDFWYDEIEDQDKMLSYVRKQILYEDREWGFIPDRTK